MHLGKNLEFFPNFSAAQIKFMSSEPSTSKTISDDEKLELLYAKPVIDGKNFYNPPSFKNWTGLPGLKSFFKWKLFETDNSNVPKNEEKLEQSLPISNLTNFSSKTPNSSLFATWLGHSTVLVQLDGLCFITDPIWAERASFLSFVGPKRYRPPPMKIKDLPELDVGVISHDHYDHLDISAVKRITSKNPSMRWFVPLKIKELLESNGIQNDLSNPSRITEMTWGQEVVISKKDTKFSVWCLPAQHWGQRGPFDRYKRLWSGWAIVGPTRRFYYSGDTGNCEEEFEKIGNHLGPFDLAAIPIGAYEPNWFMKSQHINPEEAVGVHQLIKSKISIGVHWGTYPMGSYEHYLEPRDKLAEIMSTRRDLNHTKFITIDQGTIWDEANFKNA